MVQLHDVMCTPIVVCEAEAYVNEAYTPLQTLAFYLLRFTTVIFVIIIIIIVIIIITVIIIVIVIAIATIIIYKT